MCPKTTELSNKIEENFNDTLSFSKGSVVKDPPEMQETEFQSLGWEAPLEKEMTIHFIILA